MILEELEVALSRVKGVGPASLKTLSAMGLHHVKDLVRHLPRDYEDRKTPFPFRSAIPSGGWVNARARVTGHEYFGPPGRKNLKVLLEDEAGTPASLVCFGRDFLARQLPAGMQILVCGQAQYRFKELQIASFEFVPFDPSRPHDPDFYRILPRYPLSGDLTQGFFRRVTAQALDTWCTRLDEVLPPSLAESRSLMGRSEAWHQIHFPDSPESQGRARHRLAWEELLVFQLRVLSQGRRSARTSAPASGQPAPALPDRLSAPGKALLASLPFTLTPGQESALGEILDDLEACEPMSRLLQGDVGSGKTLVALLACLETIARGHQAVLMVPTVLLARQHAATASRLLEPLGITTALMAGPLPPPARKELLAALASGQVQLLIGTHGAFSDDVAYHDLRLAVVDEQHRFGVLQRTRLFAKARVPHVLMMSATPIPRTLAHTLYGDMDVTFIRGLPATRKPVETHLARMGNEEKVYQWVRRELEQGRKAYFVYPLIEGEEGMDAELKNAEGMHAHLSGTVFPDMPCTMIHSRMDEDAKAAAMDGFTRGDTRILVATSVVEVGVDVPEATCMVIEHAERFGLTALHQLRGRVGRGSLPSWCFLVYKEPLAEDGKERLKVMKTTGDGFAIAEEDLRIRGPGDLKGLRQSGALRLRVADLSRDAELLVQARQDARAILDADPGLARPENLGLARLVRLADREDEADSQA